MLPGFIHNWQTNCVTRLFFMSSDTNITPLPTPSFLVASPPPLPLPIPFFLPLLSSSLQPCPFLQPSSSSCPFPHLPTQLPLPTTFFSLPLPSPTHLPFPHLSSPLPTSSFSPAPSLKNTPSFLFLVCRMFRSVSRDTSLTWKERNGKNISPLLCQCA